MKKSILCLLAMIGSYQMPLMACTRLFWNDQPFAKVAVRTMDLYVDEAPSLMVLPRGLVKDGDVAKNPIEWTSKYGSVVITAFAVGVSDGMNEMGLAGHLLYLHDTQYPVQEGYPGLANVRWLEYMLDNFSSVQEVVDHMKDFRLVSIKVIDKEWPLHLVVEDASGDSAILEYVDGKLVVYHSKEYRVVTNEPTYDVQLSLLKNYRYFGGNLPLPGDIDSISRFVRVSAFLKTLTQPKNDAESIAYALGVIRTAQVPFGAVSTAEVKTEDAWPTRWISAADVTNKIYYFHSVTSPNVAWLDLNTLKFDKNSPITRLNIHNQAFMGDITEALEKKAP